METPVPLCGTPRLIELRDSLRAATPLPRGAGLDFIQQPPILTTSYTGRVTIRDLGIVGDFATVKFHRVDHRRPKGVQVETWRRTRRQRIGGQTISRFTKSWPASIFREVIRTQSFGWDNPQVFWGTLKAPDADDVHIRLRLASKNLPTAIVRKIHPRVQYSSHVVNLVVNNFSNARVFASNESAFAFVAAAQLFYQHFPDVYNGLSFVMQRDVLADYGPFTGSFATRSAALASPSTTTPQGLEAVESSRRSRSIARVISRRTAPRLTRPCTSGEITST